MLLSPVYMRKGRGVSRRYAGCTRPGQMTSAGGLDGGGSCDGMAAAVQGWPPHSCSAAVKIGSAEMDGPEYRGPERSCQRPKLKVLVPGWGTVTPIIRAYWPYGAWTGYGSVAGVGACW